MPTSKETFTRLLRSANHLDLLQLRGSVLGVNQTTPDFREFPSDRTRWAPGQSSMQWNKQKKNKINARQKKKKFNIILQKWKE